MIDKFFAYARERYNIFLKRKAGEPPPWTDDPDFRKWKLTNVFREDDRTTAWFRENIRDPVDKAGDDVARLMSTVAFRWFNRTSTGEVLKPVLLGESGWEPNRAAKLIARAKPPLFTAAYVIRSDFGMLKHESILRAIKAIFDDRHALAENIRKNGTLEGCCGFLQEYRLIAGFMAYEIASDLRWTDLLRDAPDIMTWAHPGPGAARGLSRVFNGGKTGLYGGSPGKKSQAEMLKRMRELLALSRDPNNWPERWPPWEMREVEHWTCEFDKIMRLKRGEGTPKQKYFGAG